MPTEVKTVRIATINATGERFVVQQIQHDQNKVFVFGALRTYKYNRATGVVGDAKFGSGRTFLLDRVTISEMPRTHANYSMLLRQSADAARAAGHVVTESAAGNFRDHGTPAQKAARDHTRAVVKEATRAVRNGDAVALARIFSRG